MADQPTPPLLKVVEPSRDAEAVDWYPVAAWALAGESEDPPVGYPWQLLTTLGLGTFHTTNSWEYLALSCHLVTGLQDHYEHTFDSWDRKEGGGDGHARVEIMVPVDYQVEAAAKALETDTETADQFLLYRTLHSRLPAPMLEWFAADAVLYEMSDCLQKCLRNAQPAVQSSEWVGEQYQRVQAWHRGAPARDSVLGEVLHVAWEVLAKRAPTALQEEYAGAFRAPMECVPLCDVTPELRVTIRGNASPSHNDVLARFLDYALTANLLRWQELFEEEAPGSLALLPDGILRLRAAMEGDDPTGRIGTLDGWHNSDRALRLLLQARLMNLVAPPALWARLGVWGGEAPGGEWRLPLPETMRLEQPRRSPDA